MNDLTSTLGFFNTYFQLLPYFKTEIEAFDYLNIYCVGVFGSSQYNNYNEFKNRNFKTLKITNNSNGIESLKATLNKNIGDNRFFSLNGIDRLKITLGECNKIDFLINENDILTRDEIYKIFITTISEN
ncbi:MAG: hypothetical protein COW66_05520 [Flavobacteriaceae bacterium CG18_big_fil_WC_8_21_14_2_50_34_36]|nr:hypothetical protein [Flavobacteriia bacterium]PIQ18619.1 MAG: hypothetical protein COW66_05520 [Flavobacteriaceae bacterium CG18_big_fil_WC_8_21_14_2_50_34_36]